MEPKFIYIEDDKDNRQQGLKAFDRHNLSSNVIAPVSIKDCKEILENGRFDGVISDYKLSKWVGNNNEKPIILGDNKCFNGIDIAKYLLTLPTRIEIGLYSSFEGDLENKLRRLNIQNKVEVVSQKDVSAENVNEHLVKFIVKKLSELQPTTAFKVKIKPLNKIVDELPNEIQAFFAKKIIGSIKSGEYLWKAGEYSWLVGVNKDISYRYPEIANTKKYNLTKPEEEFLIRIGNDSDDIESIQDKTAKIKLNLKNILTGSQVPKPTRVIHNHFITQAICKAYLAKQADVERVNKLINKLITGHEQQNYAMFESQKILFKELAQTGNFQFGCKEDIHERLEEFVSKGFPKILDIYKCRVDLIDEEIGSVKFKSLSPEGVVRVEKFSSKFLNNHHIFNEDAQFEYTIYKTSIGGGSAHHIEPI